MLKASVIPWRISHRKLGRLLRVLCVLQTLRKSRYFMEESVLELAVKVGLFVEHSAVITAWSCYSSTRRQNRVSPWFQAGPLHTSMCRHGSEQDIFIHLCVSMVI